ncbi:unnamed protein product [Gongylonema pulchrum]|uniref:Uncharacterized protein n=1 Tax=Gongylonema pulchrum TaxID=637853 RepID=A0A183DL86_9BILA|nr:unnamed protein product [Gongylonema pulchrum]
MEALETLADAQPRVARSIPKHAAVDTSHFASRSLDNCLFDAPVYDAMLHNSIKVSLIFIFFHSSDFFFPYVLSLTDQQIFIQPKIRKKKTLSPTYDSPQFSALPCKPKYKTWILSAAPRLLWRFFLTTRCGIFFFWYATDETDAILLSHWSISPCINRSC